MNIRPCDACVSSMTPTPRRATVRRDGMALCPTCDREYAAFQAEESRERSAAAANERYGAHDEEF